MVVQIVKPFTISCLYKLDMPVSQEAGIFLRIAKLGSLSF